VPNEKDSTESALQRPSRAVPPRATASEFAVRTRRFRASWLQTQADTTWPSALLDVWAWSRYTQIVVARSFAQVDSMTALCWTRRGQTRSAALNSDSGRGESKRCNSRAVLGSSLSNLRRCDEGPGRTNNSACPFKLRAQGRCGAFGPYTTFRSTGGQRFVRCQRCDALSINHTSHTNAALQPWAPRPALLRPLHRAASC